MIKKHLKYIWSIVAAIGVLIGIISGLITIDGWLQDRYTKDTPNVTIEQNYYIDNIEVIENNGIYYKKYVLL